MKYFTIAKVNMWCEAKNMSRLLDALNSSDSEIRKASVLCLGEMGDAVVLESLEYLLLYDPDTFVRITAERAILNIKRVGLDSRINLETEDVQIAYNLNIS